MTNHGQQQQHSADDAVDEHENDHEEGEEAGAPLVVDPHNQDDHQCYEHHYGEVDILSGHSPVRCNRDTQYTGDHFMLPTMQNWPPNKNIYKKENMKEIAPFFTQALHAKEASNSTGRMSCVHRKPVQAKEHVTPTSGR